MIEITSQPPSITRAHIGASFAKQPPVPMSDCVKWCMQPDDADAITTPGSRATVVVVIPFTCTVPANGTPLRIWGYDFEVDSTQEFSASSFKVYTSGLFTVSTFGSMIFANLFFNRSVTASVAIVGSTFEVTLEWNDCREQPRFVDEDMDFEAIDDLGGSGSYLNGVSPVYVDWYKLVTRVGFFMDDTAAFYPTVAEHIASDAEKLCDAVGEVCVDYRSEIERGLWTPFPELTTDSFTEAIDLGRSMMRLFSLEYGWVYREDCQAKSGTLKLSDIVLGINAAFEIDDEFQMRRYWPNHTDGLPDGQFVVDFLTTQPKRIEVCTDSYCWLWMLNNWQLEHGDYSLMATFVLYKKGISAPFESFDFVVNDQLTDAHSFYQPVNFNVSPGFVIDNAPTLTEDNLDYYEVTVLGVDPITLETIFAATEYLRYVVKNCCAENTDLYFLSPPGGWVTQVIEITETETVREGTEVSINVACETARASKAAIGGRTIVNLRTYQRIGFSIFMENNDENRRYMKHLVTASQHKIKVPGERVFSLYPAEAVAPIAKKFLLDLNSVNTSTAGQQIELKATGYLADIPKQIGTEQ